MNGHITPSKPVIRVRRESKRSNMGQIQVFIFVNYRLVQK